MVKEKVDTEETSELTIFIRKANEALTLDNVFVGLNGEFYIIPVEKKTKVPRGVYEILQSAKIEGVPRFIVEVSK